MLVLGSLLGVAWLVGALLFMLGARETAHRILAASLILGVILPGLAAMGRALPTLLDARPLVWLLGLALVPLFVAGWKRSVDHRRHLHHWWGEAPTSLKHRVEDDV